jgi:hypothetical protein
VTRDVVLDHLDGDFITLLFIYTTRLVDACGAGEVDEDLWKYRGIMHYAYDCKKYHYLAVHRAAMQLIARPEVAFLLRNVKYVNITGRVNGCSPIDLAQELAVARAKAAISRVAHMLTPALLRRIGVIDGPLNEIKEAFRFSLCQRRPGSRASEAKFIPDVKLMLRQLNRVNLQVRVPGRRFAAFPNGHRSHCNEIDLGKFSRNRRKNQRLWAHVLEVEEGLEQAMAPAV